MVSKRLLIAFVAVGAMIGGCSGPMVMKNPEPDVPLVAVRVSGSAEFLYNFCNSFTGDIKSQAIQASNACVDRNRNNSEELIFAFNRDRKATYLELLNLFLTAKGSVEPPPRIQFYIQTGCIPIACQSGFKGWFPKPPCGGCPN
jgi:hypothetical protein